MRKHIGVCLIISLVSLILSTVIYATPSTASHHVNKPVRLALQEHATHGKHHSATKSQKADVKASQPSTQHPLISLITNPSITYILLLLGIYSLFFASITTNRIVPIALGALTLLLALYSFQLLPISYTGVSLLLGGIACLVAEVFITTYGIVGICGIAAFITGSYLLYNPIILGYHLSWTLIITMSIITVGVFFLMRRVARTPNYSILRDHANLIGKEAEVLEYHAEYILVRVQGEIWSAQCASHLEMGQKVRVKKVSNLMLTVTPNISSVLK
jgi:membrane-bound serine protease (ClpP class)